MSTTQSRGRHSHRQPLAVPRLSIGAPFYSVVAFVTCLVALAAIVAGVFKVTDVVVIGSGLPAAEIVRASGVQGENIFTVRSDAVVERVSAIRNLVVERVETEFPNRVTIVARLRPAMAAWRQGKTLFLLDPSGQIIGETRSTALPVITGTGNAHHLGPSVILAVREATHILPHGTVAEFQYGPRHGLSIIGRPGWTAILGTGSAQTLANRLATLAAFLRATRNRPQQLLLVDLRYRVPYARYAP